MLSNLEKCVEYNHLDYHVCCLGKTLKINDDGSENFEIHGLNKVIMSQNDETTTSEQVRSAELLERLLSGKSKLKENRWDRIRRKHLNNITVTSKTVKRFFNMDFIDDSQLKILNGDGRPRKTALNPVLVMDIR